MAGQFFLKKFNEIDLNDPFFDSLKKDYPGTKTTTAFVQWFNKKATEDKTALVFNDEYGIGAFVCTKIEAEEICLQNSNLPKLNRLKISTIKIAERFQGQRLGEGAIGLVLWQWQRSRTEEIYVTVFPAHDKLIGQLQKFGFVLVGLNSDGEHVYLRSRKNIDYSDPYKAFPFVDPSFKNAGYLIVNDIYHDTMFPYSELKNTLQTSVALSVRNGLSKIYIGNQVNTPPYKIGEPIFIYRRHSPPYQRKYKSCLTSFCIVTDIIPVIRNGIPLMSFDDLIKRIGNKSVFDENEIRSYYNKYNMFVIEMLYSGFFGEGNNINRDWLDRNGCWGEGYPTNIRLSPDQFRMILREGNIDVNNIIIN